MKIHGERPGPMQETIIIAREPHARDVVFIAKSVLDDTVFMGLCPFPKPRMIISREKGKIPDPKDPNFERAVEIHQKRRSDWIIIQSLRESPGLEWEKVDYNKPETWQYWDDELAEAGFSEYEKMMIVNGVSAANGLSEQKLKEARDRFLASEAELSLQSSSQKDEPKTSLFGEPASDSGSDLQE